ncbi:MAG: hypothetical protein CALGDGBN_02552 [Pseudomonadales bacterium]|nr:hypothetical protein [Pseudomonadales bacterium]
MNPAELTLQKEVIAWVTLALLLFGGWFAYERLGRFEAPEFVIRQAVVVTSYPGASPAQVAEEVTDLVEGPAKIGFARTHAELDQVCEKLHSKVAEAARGPRSSKSSRSASTRHCGHTT